MKHWSLGILGGILVLSLLAPVIAPYDPMGTDVDQLLQPPSPEHILGTDTLGRDVWSRLLYGGQHTLGVTSLATILAVVSGTFLGFVSGLMGKRWDYFFIVFTNGLLAFPGLLLALVIVTIVGTGNESIIIATGLAQTALVARVSRAAIFEVRSNLYIDAAKASGATNTRIATIHILPNTMPTLLTYAAITFAYCLLNSAALSFLGLGGQPGIPDWGVMLAEGRMAFRTAPWIAFSPGIAITVVVWCVNNLADQMNISNR